MNVLSLFDGISCGQLALQRAGIKVDNYYASEIDKYAIKIAQKNYPNTIHIGNAMYWDEWVLPKIDIMLAGSPCTFWSIAKKNREVDKTGMGWQLFMYFVGALRKHNPKYFLYENVASMPKEIKAFITAQLGVEPIMINSALVSAQQRKRLYWTNIPGISQLEDKGIYLKDILESGLPYQDRAHTITASYNGAIIQNSLERRQRSMIAEPIRIGDIGINAQAHRVYSVQGKTVCISASGGGQGAKTGLYKIDLPDGDYIIRKLTPIEAERCQTLPDNYTEGISNTQRYKCIGNGWTVDVISHILRGVENHEQR